MIRLWTLGRVHEDPTKCIIPSRQYINNFREQLKNRNEDGSLDIVMDDFVHCMIIYEKGDEEIIND